MLLRRKALLLNITLLRWSWGIRSERKVSDVVLWGYYEASREALSGEKRTRYGGVTPCTPHIQRPKRRVLIEFSSVKRIFQV